MRLSVPSQKADKPGYIQISFHQSLVIAQSEGVYSLILTCLVCIYQELAARLSPWVKERQMLQ